MAPLLSLIASASHRDGPVLHAQWIDADRLLSVAERDVPRLWGRDGTTIAALGRDNEFIEDAALGPDGLIATWHGAQVALWDRNGKRHAEWTAAATVRQVILHTEGLAAIEAGDSTIRVIELMSGVERRRWWHAHALIGGYGRICFCQHETTIVADFGGIEFAKMRLPGVRPLAMPRQDRLVLGGVGGTGLHAAADLRPLARLPSVPPLGLHIAAIGVSIALLLRARRLVVLDADTGGTTGDLVAPAQAICHGGKGLLMLAMADRRLVRWLPGAAGGEVVKELVTTPSAVASVRGRIVVGDVEGYVHLIGAPATRAHRGEVLGLHHHPTEQMVVSRGRDGRLGFWRCA